MIEQAIIFAFLAMLFWGIEDFLAQKSARKIGDVESLAVIMIIGAIIFTPFVIPDFSLLDKSAFIILGIVAVIHFSEGLLYFESLKKGKLAVIDVIFEFELPITIVLGIFIFKESLSTMQFCLIGLIFLGILMIATKSLKQLKIRLERGVLIAMIAAVSMALVNFSSAFSSRLITPSMTLWFVWISNAILCLAYIIYHNKGKKFCTDCWDMKTSLVIMSIVATLAWFFYFIAIEQASLSVITAITEAYPVVAISLALFINKEKLNWHQYVGIGFALISAISLALI